MGPLVSHVSCRHNESIPALAVRAVGGSGGFMQGRGWRKTIGIWAAALMLAAGTGPSRSGGALPPPAGELPVDGGSPAAPVVAQAEGALTNLDAKRLAAPFGGAVPVWARDWVERRGHDD